MTIDEIKELIRILQDTGIAELEVQKGEDRVWIKRSVGVGAQEVVLPTVLPLTVNAAAAAPSSVLQSIPSPPEVAAPVPGEASKVVAPSESSNDQSVKSPIVGTYYDAPSPGTPPFVKIGDRVEPKQVLCIIESMKLMNEIEAEVSGTLVAKMVENGRPVEYGETLFTIRPH